MSRLSLASWCLPLLVVLICTCAVSGQLIRSRRLRAHNVQPSFPLSPDVDGNDHASVLPLGDWTPYGVSFDKANNVYLADGYNHRIHILAPNGTMLSSLATPVLVFSITVDSSDHIWAVYNSQSDQRVVKLDLTGRELLVLTTSNPPMTFPFAVAVDRRGNVWVSDRYNNRMVQFSSEGKLLSQFPVTLPTGVDLDSAGRLYIALGSRGIGVYDTNGTLLSTLTGNGTVARAYSLRVACDELYVVDWNIDTDLSQIVKMTTSGAPVMVYTNDNQLSDSRSVAVDFECKTLVTSTDDRFVRLDVATGKQLQEMKAPHLIGNPWGACLDASEEHLYITDIDQNIGLKLTRQGVVLQVFNTSDPAMDEPEGIAIDSAGNVFVTDRSNDRVVKFDSDGTVSQVYITADPALSVPAGVTVDTSNHLYIMDTGNNRIVKIDSATGKLLSVLSDPALNLPVKAVLDLSNNVYVANGGSNPAGATAVVQFSPDGKLVGTFSTPREYWSFTGDHPIRGFALDATGNLLITQTGSTCFSYSSDGNCTSVLLTQDLVKISPNNTVISLYKTSDGMPWVTSALVDKTGNIVAVDYTNTRVITFHPAADAVPVVTDKSELTLPLGKPILLSGVM